MNHPHFDTGNEYSDNTFLDVDYGIHGGFKGGGFAETTIRRSRFLRNAKAGVALGNFNALDIWIWYSLFEDCDTGVTNTPGAGNYHIYNSVFRFGAFRSGDGQYRRVLRPRELFHRLEGIFHGQWNQ